MMDIRNKEVSSVKEYQTYFLADTHLLINVDCMQRPKIIIKQCIDVLYMSHS